MHDLKGEGHCRDIGKPATESTPTRDVNNSRTQATAEIQTTSGGGGQSHLYTVKKG
jgi:hypothetical protein